MATPELDDGDKAVLAALLRQVIAADPVPHSPRVKRLRAILTKLELTVVVPAQTPALNASMKPATGGSILAPR